MSFQPPINGIPQAPELGNDQTHFSCSICSKRFTKRLSRNRHVLYCRQKQLKQNHSRKKSCTLCRRAKTRCSEEIPQCTRCKANGLECKYEGERQKDSDMQLLGLDAADSQKEVEADLTALGEELATLPAQACEIFLSNSSYEEQTQVDTQLDGLTSYHDYQLGTLLDHEINFDWNFQAPQYQGKDYFSNPSGLEIAHGMCKSTRQLTMPSYPEGSIHMAGNLENESSLKYFQDLLPRSSYFNKSDVEISLLSARAGGIESIPFTTPKNGLFRRRERSFGSQLSCYYLLQTLRSYPKMLLSDSLPPFIHKNCGGVGGRNAVASSMDSPSPSLEEPLAICKSITSTLDEDNISGSSDAKVIHVMMAVAAKIEDRNITYGTTQHGEWQRWTLQESRDRTFTLLFIINKLFDINPTHDPNNCNAIMSMPVPAHRSLWEAPSYLEWKNAHTKFLQRREGRPSLTYRDMVELHQKNQTGQTNTLGDLDDWFLNLDSFGTFVLMTATSI
ncbi:hypothetical protein V492_01885 [Pseudogymnoascus sp. VKM F-4246]|nr:hypothetical protein V492_01885 [Pseudogymnoascus sp. VKM F-4246]